MRKRKRVATRHAKLRLKIAKYKQQLKYRSLMRKIFAELDSEDWEVEVVRFVEYNKPENLLGFIEPWSKKIYIDVRSQIILTLVHETLHAVFYKYTEQAIRHLENFIRTRLSRHDLVKLMSYVLTSNGLLRKNFPLICANREP